MDQNQVKVELTFPQKLRQMADFFEEHPELPTPGMFSLSLVPVFDLGNFAAVARIAASIPGSRKAYSEDCARIHIPVTRVSEYFNLQFYISRNEVCKPVEFETKVVPEHIEERATKWECQPLLGLDKLMNDSTLDNSIEIE